MKYKIIDATYQTDYGMVRTVPESDTDLKGYEAKTISGYRRWFQTRDLAFKWLELVYTVDKKYFDKINEVARKHKKKLDDIRFRLING